MTESVLPSSTSRGPEPAARTRGRRGRLAALALTAVAATSCGLDLHPGVAATVNGETISQDRVDELVSAACNFVELSNKDKPVPRQVGVSTLRTSLTSSLISFALADEATDKLNLTVYSGDVEAADTTEIPAGLSDSDTTLLGDFFYDLTQEQVQRATIGAHLKDDSVMTSKGVSSDDVASADSYMTKLFTAADVDVNPSYGSWDGSVVKAASGSLSDPVSTEARFSADNAASDSGDVSGLPPSQVCG